MILSILVAAAAAGSGPTCYKVNDKVIGAGTNIGGPVQDIRSWSSCCTTCAGCVRETLHLHRAQPCPLYGRVDDSACKPANQPKQPQTKEIHAILMQHTYTYTALQAPGLQGLDVPPQLHRVLPAPFRRCSHHFRARRDLWWYVRPVTPRVSSQRRDPGLTCRY